MKGVLPPVPTAVGSLDDCILLKQVENAILTYQYLHNNAVSIGYVAPDPTARATSDMAFVSDWRKITLRTKWQQVICASHLTGQPVDHPFPVGSKSTPIERHSPDVHHWECRFRRCFRKNRVMSLSTGIYNRLSTGKAVLR